MSLHTATYKLSPMQTGNRRDIDLTRRDIRRGLKLASINAAVWAIGNGLVSTALVIYLANDLGARGLAISFILAAPHFAGILRLATPALIKLTGSRRIVCLAAFLLSTAVLWTVPRLTNPSAAITGIGDCVVCRSTARSPTGESLTARWPIVAWLACGCCTTT